MSWVSHLPPTWLATIESLLYVLVFVFAILGALSAFLGRQVGGYRAALEKLATQNELARTREELSNTREELSAKNKAVEQVAAEAQKRSQELIEKQKPRMITSDQRERFLERLRLGPKGSIYLLAAVMGDGEAQALAVELGKLFQAAGWPVQNFAYNWASTSTPIGVALIVHSQEKAPPHAISLQKALETIGLQAPGHVDPNQPEGSLTVVVGPKP